MSEFVKQDRTIQDSLVEVKYLANSLKTIQVELRRTAEAVVDLHEEVNRTGVSWSEINERITELQGDPQMVRLARAQLRLHDGPMGYLRYIFDTLRKDHERISKLVDIVAEANGEMSLTDLAIRIGEKFPGDSTEPGAQPFLICLVSGLTCAVVIIVIIVLEGEAGGDQGGHGEPGDFPEGPAVA
ncbi:hypothetical protein JBE04_08865 [Streptomyces sp. PRKS01-29]|nr:hypothetical protein [Streptomyces sabulosicollis]MBI0294590.1 hypothetical protein [Streptomyces sabulosicollis]